MTVRRGSRVERRRMGSLNEAIEELRAEVESVQAAGGLPKISAFRTYEPGQRVHARIEISIGRLLGKREAGVDVMGDGALVPYTGAVFKSQLDADSGADVFEAIHAALVPG
ncbi:MAG: helix-loop-helix domain-containing protein [Solirubrobacterales bacterium]